MSAEFTDQERAEIAERYKEANERSLLFAEIKSLETIQASVAELLKRLRARLGQD